MVVRVVGGPEKKNAKQHHRQMYIDQDCLYWGVDLPIASYNCRKEKKPTKLDPQIGLLRHDGFVDGLGWSLL